MTHEQLTLMIREAAHAVFDTMLNTPLVDRDAYVQTEAPDLSEGVLAFVGLAGSWVGSGAFSCSTESAKRISSALLMQDFPAIDSDVLDAIGEVANMILGNVKTALEDILGPMGLSIPTVVYGRNFTTRSVRSGKWTVVPFTYLDDTVEVHLCLTPHTHPRIEQQRTASAVLAPTTSQ